MSGFERHISSILLPSFFVLLSLQHHPSRLTTTGFSLAFIRSSADYHSLAFLLLLAMAAIKRLLAQPAILLVGLLSFIGLQANAAAVGSNAVRDDFSQMSKRQATSFYPIEGFKTKVVERRSITTLQSQYPDIFNMLLLAWRNLQLRGENLDLSYFKVAGQFRICRDQLVQLK